MLIYSLFYDFSYFLGLFFLTINLYFFRFYKGLLFFSSLNFLKRVFFLVFGLRLILTIFLRLFLGFFLFAFDRLILKNLFTFWLILFIFAFAVVFTVYFISYRIFNCLPLLFWGFLMSCLLFLGCCRLDLFLMIILFFFLGFVWILIFCSLGFSFFFLTLTHRLNFFGSDVNFKFFELFHYNLAKIFKDSVNFAFSIFREPFQLENDLV